MRVKKNPITIVTVTYNSSKTIVPLLKSIDQVSNNDLIDQVIIIENNSPDGLITRNLINKIKSTIDTKIKFILSKNNGFARSCNLGASKAKSDYVLFLNPDTCLKTNSLRTLYQHALCEHSDIIGGVSERMDGGIHETVVRHPNLTIGLFEFSNLGKLFHIEKGHRDFYYGDKKSIYKSKIDLKVDAIGGAYLMVKVESFKILKGFDEKIFMYLEDVDLGYRANKIGMNVVFCPHSQISHVGGASSKNKQHIRHQAWYDSRKYYFKKHYGIFINMIIQPIFTVEEFLLKMRTK